MGNQSSIETKSRTDDADKSALGSGLSGEQALARLKEAGYNELPSAKRRSTLKVLFGVLQEPMIFLLVACAGTYLFLGDPVEGLVLLLSVAVVVGISLVQESKSENALHALKELASPRALVIRDGREIRVPGREVVPGDVVVLYEGDRVPADGEILLCRHLRVDESLLTGESLPVTKNLPDPERSEAMGRVYSGTLVVGGSGVYRVTATGSLTEIGRIGKSLEAFDEEPTLIQRQAASFIKVFAAIGFAASVLIVLVYGLTKGDWPHAFLAGVAAAVSLLPEEIPVVLTVFFAIGAWRISKRNVLTRKVAAIENLGAISVLCVDKTGTITRNEMRVTALGTADKLYYRVAEPELLPEEFHRTIEYGVLASHIDPFDPMEKAIHRSLGSKLAGTDHVHRDWKLIREYPLSTELLAMSCVWQSPRQDESIIASKGAPEVIIDLCHLPGPRREAVLSNVREMASQGLRVLGVARATFQGDRLPGAQHDFEFQFVGLIGLEDPVRPEAVQAVQECHEAGIRILMMTGDYAETAKHVGRKIGLEEPDAILTGTELQSLSESELQARLRRTNLFARMVPDQKLRIVKALQADGAIVAMTGDGVNDAPSLKWADIGIAMGKRGTDVAREASDIVLLDDNFASIVAGIRLGRRIYDNIQKAISYILAIHIPIAGIAILPAIFRMPLILMPVHIVFLELIVDPACSLVFEAEEEEAGVMRRPPRKAGAPLFSLPRILTVTLHGALPLLMVFGLYGWLLSEGRDANAARATAFAALVLSNLGLILGNLSWSGGGMSALKGNRIFFWVLTGAISLLATVLFVPFFQKIFGFGPPPPLDLALGAGIGILTVAIVRIFRFARQ